MSDAPTIKNGKCSKCGQEIEVGYGLAGGGIGVYEFCANCNIIFNKTMDPEYIDDQELREKERAKAKEAKP